MSAMRSSWIEVVAAVFGGVVLGIGVGNLIVGRGLAGVVWAVVGVVILWWALAERRRERAADSSRTADDMHTLE